MSPRWPTIPPSRPGQNTVSVAFTIPESVRVRLDARARQRGLSRAEYLRQVLAQALTPEGSAS